MRISLIIDLVIVIYSFLSLLGTEHIGLGAGQSDGRESGPGPSTLSLQMLADRSLGQLAVCFWRQAAWEFKKGLVRAFKVDISME